MQKGIIAAAIVTVLFCLCGCEMQDEHMTLQEETVPVVVVEGDAEDQSDAPVETVLSKETMIAETRITVKTRISKTTETTVQAVTSARRTETVPVTVQNGNAAVTNTPVQPAGQQIAVVARESTPATQVRETPVTTTENTQEPEETTETEVRSVFGSWYYEVQNAENPNRYDITGYVTVRNDGTYFYQPRDGSRRTNGTVRTEQVTEGGKSVPFYVFYENEGNTCWIRMKCAQNDADVFEINQGAARLFRRDLENTSFVDYIGMWRAWERDDLTLKVSDEGVGYRYEIRREDGPSAYSIWTFYCIGSDDNTYMYCFGEGSLVQVTADGERTEVYNDAKAQFKKRSDMIYWSNIKAYEQEEQGEIQIVFVRIE